jgi:predicted dehydrogenase
VDQVQQWPAPRDHGWLNDASLGGGWLGASGSHDIDALRFLFGDEVVAGNALLRTEIGMRPDGAGGEAKSTAEDAFSMWLEFAGGGTASVDSAFAACMPLPTTFTLIGSTGAISITDDTHLSILRRKQEPEHIEVRRSGRRLHGRALHLGAEVTEAMNTGTQIAPNFDDGVAAAEVMDMLRAGGKAHRSMSVTYETIRYEIDGPVATITLNRPEVLNAMGGGMTRELLDAVEPRQ